MASSFQRDLKKLSRHLVQIHRPAGMPTVFGFVVGSSDELVLLHSFNSEVFCLDGYDVIRQCDIRSFCFFDDPRYWRYRAIRRLKIRPTPPRDVRLVSVQDLLSSISARYPLLSAHRETPRRHTTYVGPVISMAERSFTIEDADYFGQWTGPRRLRYADVTRVCFDGGFLRASAMTAQRIGRNRP
ncbi:MAG: hypothetical protein IH623_17760 [Verrucomicrobia bacterium]|nr:hypothetical protein [Verrucomicrobiota bacterium]